MPDKKEKDQKAQWTGKQPIAKRVFNISIRSHSCIKCLRLIEIIHRLNKSTDRIESQHCSELKMLKIAVKIAMSDMLDIISALN